VRLQFQAYPQELTELSSSEQSQYLTVISSALTFRECKRGETVEGGACVTCATGTYSLEYPVTTKTTCDDCTSKSGVTTCYADVLVIQEGYWRRHNTSIAVLDCLESSSCIGGAYVANDLCETGYEGPLCAVCADGYYRDGQQCSVCDDSGSISSVLAFYIAVAILLVGVMTFFFYLKCIDTKPELEKTQSIRKILGEIDNLSTDSGEVNSQVEGTVSGSDALPKPTFKERAMAWFQAEYKDLRIKLKIVITTYQIISAIPSVLSVRFPSAFDSFLGAFNVFNLNVVSSIPVGCTQNYTFVDELVFTTLFPIALALILLTMYILDALWQVRVLVFCSALPPAVLVRLHRLNSQYLTYFFFLTYLVLPSVSTKIFQMFLCTNVDPRDEDNDTYDTFLIADMDISCTSEYYYKGVAYAAVMLLVYVIGVPLMYFVLLYRNREELSHRDDIQLTHDASTQTYDGADPAQDSKRDSRNRHSRSHPRALSSHVSSLAFLWDAYEPQFWYWEVVETTRRLMLTAVLSVCGAGTSAQSIFAVLLGLVCIKLYGYYQPYDADSDDIIAEVGQFQIFFSFLGALIYQKSLLGSEWNDYVSAALVLINVTIAILFLYFAFVDLGDDLAQYAEERHHKKPGIWACVCGDRSIRFRSAPLTPAELTRASSGKSSPARSPSKRLGSPAKSVRGHKLNKRKYYTVDELSRDEFPGAFSFPPQSAFEAETETEVRAAV
jgi:hypothetical protein